MFTRDQLRAVSFPVSAYVLVMVILALANSFAVGQIMTGSYVGDDSHTRAITGLGGQLGVVIIKGNFHEPAVLRTSTMECDGAKVLGHKEDFRRNTIKSIDADGFTIGKDKTVNRHDIVYYWTGIKVIPGEIAVGFYEGNGVDRSITGLGFSPAYVIVVPEDKDDAVHRSSTMPTTYSFDEHGKAHSRITSLDADGFSVDRHGEINKRGKKYHYIALKAQTGVFAVGTYRGDSGDDRLIDGIGVAPEYLIIEGEDKGGPVQRMNSLTGDATLEFSRGEVFANGIQELRGDGFEIGSGKSVNRERKMYHWMAFGSPVLAGVREETPVDFQLAQNYPNPFNPTTTISFTLAASGAARLVVYDVLGRKVKELANETFAAGAQSITWNATNEAGVSVSSGVYYARLSLLSGGKQQISMIKMLLMK